ncbi:MAG: carboxypeptidase-like regulatory domain-containing protein [Candidatus Micrarchaeota archaeon]
MSKFLVAFLALALVLAACFSEASSASVASEGGNITQANFSLVQHSDVWKVFWGNQNSSVSSASISVSNETATNISNATRSLQFPSTYEYYIISDVSNPFTGSYAAATTSEFDSHFGISGYESSQYVFSSTSTFNIYTDSYGTYSSLSLPTLYMSGEYSNGTPYSNAFREGVAKAGSNLIFIVPVSSYYGANGEDIDYQFAVPYEISSSNTFYLFSVSTPLSNSTPAAQASQTQTTGSTLPVGFSWSYDGVALTILTEAGASISARDELGASYSATADSNGRYSFKAPAGYRYFISITKEGFSPASGSIYIPVPTVKVDSQNASNQTGQAPKDAVILKDTDTGTILCVGSDCYAPENGDSLKSVEALSELSCSGTICRFVGISEAEFVSKYNLRKIPITSPPPLSGSPPVFDFGQFFTTVGQEISSGLGSSAALPDRERNLFLYVFTFFAVIAVFVYALKRHSGRKFSGGYD